MTYFWLTEEFLLRILKKCNLAANIQIVSYNVADALKKGENFASHMNRITVNYTADGKHCQIKFILKAAHTTGTTAALTESLGAFEREISIYTKILPKISFLLESIGDYNQFAPKCFAADETPKYLVFEDLREVGYKNVDKAIGLDYNHLEIVISSLAKWHATTAFLYVMNPDLFKRFDKPILSKNTPSGLDVFLSITAIGLASVCKQWDGFGHISKKLTEIRPRIFEKSCESYKKNEIDFQILTHGDLWANNLMFKYNENNQVSGCMMLDFALGSLTTPGKDIAYSLFTTTTKDVRENEWNKLIRLYHTILQDILIKLSYPKRIPSFEDIYKSFLKCTLYIALAGIFVTAHRQFDVVHNGEGLEIFVSQSKEDFEFREKMFNAPKSRDDLKFLLDFCYRNGFFDI